MDVTSAVTAWKEITRNSLPTKQDVEDISRKYNVLCGKWMLFPGTNEVDQMWNKIGKAIQTYTLSCHGAKVSPRNNNNDTHLICVYTSNYLNKEDVMLVREELRKMGFSRPLPYKADIYTHLNIYSGNSWKIPVSVYNE